MRKYILYYLFLFFHIQFISAYIIPEEEIRQMETIDHEVCITRGHSFNSEYTIRLYWECRLSLMSEKIDNFDHRNTRSKFYLTELKKIKKVIKNIISIIESDFQVKLDFYDPKKKERKIIFKGNENYYYNLLNLINITNTTTDINTKKEIEQIKKERDQKINGFKKTNKQEQLRHFPVCVKYDLKSKDFEKCIDKYMIIENCKNNITKVLKQKDDDIKFTCKKQAIELYPDYMALYNSEFEELKKIKMDSYVYNKEEIEKIQNRIYELNKLMSGPRLSKTQLIDLRKFSEQKCLIDHELEVNFFMLSLSSECDKLLKESGE